MPAASRLAWTFRTMSQTETDVVIVGGGPVGIGLAIELSQRGVSSIVVERFEDPQPIPKGQNLTQRTMEHFHQWGIDQAIRAAAPLPLEQGIGGLTAYGTLLSDYHYDWYQRVVVRPYYFADNERLPQYDTEKILRRRAAQCPDVETIYGWSAESLGQDDNAVSATITHRQTGQKRRLTGRYLVGCDGSKSIVRDSVGITQTLSDHDKLMVLLVFHAPELGRLLSRYRGKSFFNVLHPELEGYWLFFGRVDSEETWFFHAPVPFGTTADNYDFKAYLQRAVGAAFACDIQHIGFWDLRFAVADTYRKDRVFIAGDAAHGHPPYGGFGINTGFEDARNLGWKLAAVQKGWGGPGLLDSYSLERQPVFASTAKDFIASFINADRAFLQSFDPERDRAAFEQAWDRRKAGTTSEIISYEPHYAGSPIVFGPAGGTCSAKGEHRFEARAGHHLAPQRLSSGRNVFEALGPDFSLLAFDADPATILAFERAADRLGVPLKIIQDDAGNGRQAYQAELVLVRPDSYIAWAGEGCPADVDAHLRQVIGAA